MKRPEFLQCAGVDAARFKVLKQRGQLPFVFDTVEEENSNHPEHFTLHNAFRLRLFLDLIGNDGSTEYPHPGVVPSYALTIIENGLNRLEGAPLEGLETAMWVAVVIVEDAQGDNQMKLARRSMWFAGELSALTAWIDENTIHDGSKPVRILMANASRAADFVSNRAEKMKLSEAEVLGKA